MEEDYSMFGTETVNANSFKQDLSHTVKEYLTLESEIQKLNIALKERKLKMKALSGMILESDKVGIISGLDHDYFRI